MENMGRLILNKYTKIQTYSILLALTIFIISVVIGYSIDLGFESGEKFTASTIEVFLHNLSLCLIFIIGVLSFGIVSLFLLFINGVYLGSAINFYVANYSFKKMTLIFAPHAIFELPAIILSASIGFLLLLIAVERGNKGDRIPMKVYLKYIIKCIIIVIILLGIASLLETNVSMKFI